MISEKIIPLLRQALPIYDRLEGKDYLIACNIRKQFPLEFYVFRIRKENFWHLLGCECLNTDGVLNAETLYDEFKRGHSVREHLSYTSNANGCKEKYEVFKHIFDFIEHAKELRISKTNGTPEQYQFRMTSGNYKGIVGYDSRRTGSREDDSQENNSRGSDYLFPKTIQRKSISNVSREFMRISFILSGC